MFDLDIGKTLLFGAVLLIAVGPKELPTALRKLAHIIRRLQGFKLHLLRQLSETLPEVDLPSDPLSAPHVKHSNPSLSSSSRSPNIPDIDVPSLPLPETDHTRESDPRS